MSIKAIKRYIEVSTNKINLNSLKQDATALPKRHKSWKSFKASFGNSNHFNYEFCGYKIHIDLSYAFKHFLDNTYSEKRGNINSTLLPTLKDPLIVIKTTYQNKPALTFYKPFVNENNLLHIMMYKAVLDNGNTYRFRTIYEVSNLEKVKNVIKTIDLNTVYFKH